MAFSVEFSAAYKDVAYFMAGRQRHLKIATFGEVSKTLCTMPEHGRFGACCCVRSLGRVLFWWEAGAAEIVVL